MSHRNMEPRRVSPVAVALLAVLAVIAGVVLIAMPSASAGYLAAWVIGLLIFFGVVFLLYFLIMRGTRAVLGPRRRLEGELGLDVLRRRLARGEITQDQFDQGKRALGI